jgi:hypothetical protein
MVWMIYHDADENPCLLTRSHEICANPGDGRRVYSQASEKVVGMLEQQEDRHPLASQ